MIRSQNKLYIFQYFILKRTKCERRLVGTVVSKNKKNETRNFKNYNFDLVLVWQIQR